MVDWISQVDFRILDGIQNTCRHDVLDWFLPKFTSLGEKGWIYIVTAIVLLLIPAYRKWGASLATALIFGLIFGNMMIKNLVGRTRPYDLVEYYNLLVKPLSDYSFPSGHTMAAFEFFAVVCMMPIKLRYKIMIGFCSVLMAFSRLYLYVHFPSDVLAGALLGSLFGFLAVRLVKAILDKRNQMK